jgi:hypothetical protein
VPAPGEIAGQPEIRILTQLARLEVARYTPFDAMFFGTTGVFHLGERQMAMTGKHKADDGSMILYRKLGPPYSEEDHADSNDPYWEYWQLEYYQPGGRGFPSGVAWVSASHDPERDLDAILRFLIVDDECRRHGIGLKLIAAAHERWPRIFALADRVGGEALLRKANRMPGNAIWIHAGRTIRIHV